MIYWETEGKRDLIGSTDVGMRSERDRKADNVSRLVYVSVSFVTAEQPTKSQKKGKVKKQAGINIIIRGTVTGSVWQSCTVDIIIDF